MNGEDLVENMILPAIATSTTISSLVPLTMYTIAVYVLNTNGRGLPTIIQTSTLTLSK